MMTVCSSVSRSHLTAKKKKKAEAKTHAGQIENSDKNIFHVTFSGQPKKDSRAGATLVEWMVMVMVKPKAQYATIAHDRLQK